MPITVKRHYKFDILYNRTPDINFIICIGGRGGKKSYEVSKFAAFDATIRRRRVAVLRDERETIRESILNEIFLRYDTANRNGHFDGVYEKIETGIRDKETGNMLVFTKGFRASSLEKRTHLKGVSDTDTALVEEAEDIRDFSKFNVFRDSIRTEGRLIIVILNTPDIQHWIVKRYFNLKAVYWRDLIEEYPFLKKAWEEEGCPEVLDGYWELVPKDIPGFACIQTSYKDNEYLPEDVVRDYESYGDPKNATMFDLHYFFTNILGLASTGRKGQILTKVKPIKLKDYLALQFKEFYGLDFGTSSPAGIIGCKFHKNNSYARQLNYKPLDTLRVGKKLCSLGIDENDDIIADSADPTSIGRLRRGWPPEDLSQEDIEAFPGLLKGFNIRGAIKGQGSVEDGLGIMKGMNLFVVEEDEDFWNEILNYVYAQDKFGNYTNEPVLDFDHLIDPWRYVIQAKGRYF